MSKTKKSSLKTIQFLSSWMDNKFRVPGTNITFGIDAIMSLIPGFGDLASTGISVGIFGMILKEGVPVMTALRMMVNILIDSVVSTVPVLGTIADVGFKANVRNLKLLEEHLNTNDSEEYAYGIWIVFGLTLLLLFLIFVVLTVVIWRILQGLF